MNILNWIKTEFKNAPLAIIIALFAFAVSVRSCSDSSHGISAEIDQGTKSLEQGDFANNLSKIMVENSRSELETAKKKLSFDIINALYKDFYQFDANNSLVIRKLKAKQRIDDSYNLGLYLNGFEDLYEQCKVGLISKEQIRIHFLHLIGTTCNNQQAEEVLANGGNGLKLLCLNFYPESRLAKKAKTEKLSCN